jgi:hypothetical protein
MERVAILVTLLIIGRKSLENTGERGGGEAMVRKKKYRKREWVGVFRI